MTENTTTVAPVATGLKEGGGGANGYVFLCRNATQAACIEKRLFAASEKEYDRVMAHIKEGTQLFLLNIDSGVLVGIFVPVGNPGLNLEPGAFDRDFPTQVRVRPIAEPLVAIKLRDRLRGGGGPKTPQEVELLCNQLLSDSAVDPLVIDPMDQSFRQIQSYGYGKGGKWGMPWYGKGPGWGVRVPGRSKGQWMDYGIDGGYDQHLQGHQKGGGKCKVKGKRIDTVAYWNEDEPMLKRPRLEGEEKPEDGGATEIPLSAVALGRIAESSRKQFASELERVGDKEGVSVEVQPPLHVSAAVGAADDAAGVGGDSGGFECKIVLRGNKATMERASEQLREMIKLYGVGGDIASNESSAAQGLAGTKQAAE